MNGELDKLIKQLGDALYRCAESELANQWKLITLDARYDHGGGILAKIRADTVGESTVSVKSDNAIDLLLIALRGCRDSIGSRWYGLIMTVAPSMKCRVDFNYDPDCEQDKAFFKDL